MQFCTDHWQQLREAIRVKGLASLVAQDGDQAASRLTAELQQGPSIDTFDPLMGAHNAIVNKTIEILTDQYGQNPMLLMVEDPEHPELRCPICALNYLHRQHVEACTKPDCDWPREHDWTDDMIGGSTDFMVAEWKRLNA